MADTNRKNLLNQCLHTDWPGRRTAVTFRSQLCKPQNGRQREEWVNNRRSRRLAVGSDFWRERFGYSDAIRWPADDTTRTNQGQDVQQCWPNTGSQDTVWQPENAISSSHIKLPVRMQLNASCVVSWMSISVFSLTLKNSATSPFSCISFVSDSCILSW